MARQAGGWARHQGGKAITPTALAKNLGLFSIGPLSLRTVDGVCHGYERGQFLDAFTRHLLSEPLQPLQIVKPTTYEAA